MTERARLTVLPRTYRGAVPEWPLTKPQEAELTLWAELWTLPQAALWVDYHQDHQVGMYVRTLLRSQEPGATKAMGKVAHSMAVGLLLTPTSLLRAGFRISPVEAVDHYEEDSDA